jgi:hypothetical protein
VVSSASSYQFADAYNGNSDASSYQIISSGAASHDASPVNEDNTESAQAVPIVSSDNSVQCLGAVPSTFRNAPAPVSSRRYQTRHLVDTNSECSTEEDDTF